MAHKNKIDTKEIKEIYDRLQEREHIPHNPVVVYYPENDEIALESDLYDYEEGMIRCSEDAFLDYLYEAEGSLDNDEEVEQLVKDLFLSQSGEL